MKKQISEIATVIHEACRYMSPAQTISEGLRRLASLANYYPQANILILDSDGMNNVGFVDPKIKRELNTHLTALGLPKDCLEYLGLHGGKINYDHIDEELIGHPKDFVWIAERPGPRTSEVGVTELIFYKRINK